MEHRAQIIAGDLQIDLRGHRVTLGHREVVLTSREFELLCHFAKHPGWVWSRRQLLESVWGYDFGDPHIVGVHIANLRHKLGEASSAPRFIHTIRGAGYRFEPWSGSESASRSKPSVDRPAAGVPPTPPRALVGRVPEMEALRDALDAAVSGAGRLVMVGGDIGIGKSRLVEELSNEAAAQGIRVIRGLCREQGAAPWEPWPEIIRACCSVPGAGPRARCAKQLLLGEYQDRAVPRGRGDESDRRHEQVIEEIGLVVAEAASKQAVVVLLEDVHWADASSLLCLHRLSGVARSTRCLFLATYRDFEVARSPLLESLIGSALRTGGQTLLLQPLTDKDVASLVSQSLGAPPSAALLDAVYRTAGGNPLFVRELLRLLALREGDIAAVFELARQEGIRQVIKHRVRVLSLDCVRLLELAAVIGNRFSVLLAGRASGLPADRCLAILDEAEAAQILRIEASGIFVFVHQLVREAIYLSLPATRRASLHARVGEALEAMWSPELETHAAELAHHFANAGGAECATRAFSYAVLAARAARNHYAWEEASGWLRRALELRETYPGCSADPSSVASLYEELGDACFDGGHIDRAIEAFEKAIQAWPDASLADAGRRRRKLGGALLLTPHLARASLAYQEAERVMGEPSPDRPEDWWEEWLTIELVRSWGHYCAAEFDGLAAQAERIRPFIDAHGSTVHRGAFYDCLSIGDEGANRYVTTERALGHARDCLLAYTNGGGPQERCTGQCVMSLALLWLPDHPEEARIQLHRYLSLAERYGEAVHQLEAIWGLTMWHRWHNHVGKVRELSERSLALNRGRNLSCYTPCANGNLAWVAYRSGEFETSQQLASEALACMLRDEELAFPFQWQVRWPLLGVALRSGDLGEAMVQARVMLRSDQQAMSGPLETALATFLESPSYAAAEPALVLARESGYL